MTSDTVTLSEGDWESGRFYFQTSSTSSLSRSALIATLDVPEITQDVEDFGMVLVYFKTVEGFGGSPSIWTELPHSILAFGGEYYYNLHSSYQAGEIELYYYFTPNTAGNSTPNLDDVELPDYTFKYVVASGNAAASMSAEGISTANHDDVVQFLGQRFDAGEDFRVLESN